MFADRLTIRIISILVNYVNLKAFFFSWISFLKNAAGVEHSVMCLSVKEMSVMDKVIRNGKKKQKIISNYFTDELFISSFFQFMGKR